MSKTIAVEELMDVPAGQDERGTPERFLERCEDCGGIYRTGGWHRCRDIGRED